MINRQKLLDAAGRVFAEVGFRGATTRRIAEEAGVNEVTLFRQFGSKAHLLGCAVECMARMNRFALPEKPHHAERELTRWVQAHLNVMIERRTMIRKSMAELVEHPEMAPIISQAKTPHFQELLDYVNKLQPALTVAQRDANRTACAMLLGAIFSDAMGRDIVAIVYPEPFSKAAGRYVKLFLKMIDAGPSTPPSRKGARSRASDRARV